MKPVVTTNDERSAETILPPQTKAAPTTITTTNKAAPTASPTAKALSEAAPVMIPGEHPHPWDAAQKTNPSQKTAGNWTWLPNIQRTPTTTSSRSTRFVKINPC